MEKYAEAEVMREFEVAVIQEAIANAFGGK
jgi:hypothetical protein